MEFNHTTVLLNETIDMLSVRHDGIYIDGTLGGGGHSEKICEALSDKGLLIGIDRDEEALNAAMRRLHKFGNKFKAIHGNFHDIKNLTIDSNITHIDGAILDLGVSSHQLDTDYRGFSYHADAPLDMRMDRSQAISAYNIVNEYSEDELRRILWEYGEERYAKRIANRIIKARSEHPIKTTLQLVDIIKKAIPPASADKHPARRTFQAIRIEVNDEISRLEQALFDFADLLSSGGRLCVIAFHSLETKIVKNVFSKLTKGCVCPRDFPVCICGQAPKGTAKRPVTANAAELVNNNRARSANLRVFEKF